mmetsp:Transcript_22858/g.58245  ORF Transcript_22858/g.58245 Transcript_22858/m.58245 type:complete len:210 (+) Transcript_22858:146-775(+)
MHCRPTKQSLEARCALAMLLQLARLHPHSIPALRHPANQEAGWGPAAKAVMTTATQPAQPCRTAALLCQQSHPACWLQPAAVNHWPCACQCWRCTSEAARPWSRPCARPAHPSALLQHEHARAMRVPSPPPSSPSLPRHICLAAVPNTNLMLARGWLHCLMCSSRDPIAPALLSGCAVRWVARISQPHRAVAALQCTWLVMPWWCCQLS